MRGQQILWGSQSWLPPAFSRRLAAPSQLQQPDTPIRAGQLHSRSAAPDLAIQMILVPAVLAPHNEIAMDRAMRSVRVNPRIRRRRQPYRNPAIAGADADLVVG